MRGKLLGISAIMLVVLFLFNFFTMWTNMAENGLVGDMPAIVYYPLYLSLFGGTLYSLFVYKHTLQNIAIYMLFITAVAFVMGHLNGGGWGNTNYTQELCVCFLIIYSVLLVDTREEHVVKFIVYTAVASITIAVYNLATFDTSSLFALIVQRGELWNSEIFYAAAPFWFVTFFFIYSCVTRKYYWLSVSSFLVYFVLQMIATKRTFIVESLWMFVILLIFFIVTGPKKGVRSFLWGIAIAVVVMFFYIGHTDIDFSAIFESQANRLSESGMEDTGIVRFQESGRYYESASPFDIVMGKGLAVPHGGHPKNKMLCSLHIGINNIVLKFGLWLLIPYLLWLIRSLRKVGKIKQLYEQDPFGLACLLTVVVKTPIFFLIGNFWVPSPQTLFFWFCLFRSLVDYRKIRYVA